MSEFQIQIYSGADVLRWATSVGGTGFLSPLLLFFRGFPEKLCPEGVSSAGQVASPIFLFQQPSLDYTTLGSGG